MEVKKAKESDVLWHLAVEQILAGAGRFELPNAATKKRCLRPLGYAPTDAYTSSGNIRLFIGDHKPWNRNFFDFLSSFCDKASGSLIV